MVNSVNDADLGFPGDLPGWDCLTVTSNAVIRRKPDNDVVEVGVDHVGNNEWFFEF
jgi:hypothetical protein